MSAHPKDDPIRFTRITEALTPFSVVLAKLEKEIDHAIEEARRYIPSLLKERAKKHREELVKSESKKQSNRDARLEDLRSKSAEVSQFAKEANDALSIENAWRVAGGQKPLSRKNKINNQIKGTEAEIRKLESRKSVLEKQIASPGRRQNKVTMSRLSKDLANAEYKLEKHRLALKKLEKERDEL